jgi:N-acetylglutamate synthase-like GNAT family acetyltransferase
VTDWTIETYRPEHLKGVAALILSIQREEFGIAISLEDQPDLATIPAFYQSGMGQFWVAKGGGTVIGSIGLKDIGDGDLALRKMFVAAEARGSAAGVAKGLLDAAIDHAEKSGASAIYLGTTDKFHAAHRFYEKNGFQLIAEKDLPPSFPRMSVDSRFYCRKL